MCRKGGSVASLDLDRSCHTDAFDVLLALPYVDDATDWSGEWLETAKRLADCDLLITVDTAIAHLAGSMGIETWIVPPCHLEWRHMQGQDVNPWYPSWKYYRRRNTHDWPAVVARIKTDLTLRYGPQ